MFNIERIHHEASTKVQRYHHEAEAASALRTKKGKTMNVFGLFAAIFLTISFAVAGNGEQYLDAGPVGAGSPQTTQAREHQGPTPRFAYLSLTGGASGHTEIDPMNQRVAQLIP